MPDAVVNGRKVGDSGRCFFKQQWQVGGMDFTYLVAGFVALIVGVAGSVIFVVKRGRSFPLLLASLVAVTVVIDFMLLVDWSHADLMTANFLLTDFAFFTVYALVGCSIGAMPVLAGRALYRKLRASRG